MDVPEIWSQCKCSGKPLFLIWVGGDKVTLEVEVVGVQDAGDSRGGLMASSKAKAKCYRRDVVEERETGGGG